MDGDVMLLEQGHSFLSVFGLKDVVASPLHYAAGHFADQIVVFHQQNRLKASLGASLSMFFFSPLGKNIPGGPYICPDDNL